MSADDKAAAAWNDYVSQQQEEKIEELERQLNAANQRIKHLRDGIAKQNQTIEQACGKALGYPWFKDDQKNFPGATEKDGVCVGEHVAETIVSELAKRHTEVLARIKRLEELGNKLRECASQLGWTSSEDPRWIERAEAAVKAWDKESKP